MTRSSNRAFIADHWRFLCFGFMLTFTCNLGQTFFVGLYNPFIREAYSLSNGDFGALYGFATLCSAALLVWLGRLVDHIELRRYTLVVIIGMAIACLLMHTDLGIVGLGLALLLLRLCGQGLMPHISTTGMGRYFEETRGRAIGLANLGFSSGQIVLPMIAAALIALVGWRQSWAVYALGLIVLTIPLMRFLLKDHDRRHQHWEAQIALREAEGTAPEPLRAPLRQGVFRDPRFYIILPATLGSPLCGTSIFFFQAQLMAEKGWADNLFALSFPFYAVATTTAHLSGGFILDRIGGGLKLLPLAFIPYITGIVTLALTGNAAWFPVMMVLIGASTGLLGVIGGTLWPELYGTRTLGALRAFTSSVMVFSTAIAPFAVGRLYDAGISVRATYFGFAAYMIVFCLLLLPISYGRQRQKPSTPQTA